MSEKFSNNEPTGRRGFLKAAIMAAGGYLTLEAYKKHKPHKPDGPLNTEPEKLNATTTSETVADIDPHLQRLNELQIKLEQEWPSAENKILPRIELTAREFKKENAEFSYTQEIAEPETRGENIFANPEKFGHKEWCLRFTQAYRFQIITMAVERKYNLPRNLLLAMLLQESSGEEFLPNAKDDGGFGLIHMQFGTAKEFGVPVYADCPAIVCDGVDKRSCTDENGEKVSHAKELGSLIKKNRNDREKLTELDGRLNHLENIDAAGRMLAYHISRFPETAKSLPDGLKNLGPLRSAVCKYSGPKNFPIYWEKVRVFMSLLSDPGFISILENKINEKSPSATIDGKEFNFRNYLEQWQKFSLNYGVEEYAKGKCYTTEYSQNILETYPASLIAVNDEVSKRFLG